LAGRYFATTYSSPCLAKACCSTRRRLAVIRRRHGPPVKRQRLPDNRGLLPWRYKLGAILFRQSFLLRQKHGAPFAALDHLPSHPMNPLQRERFPLLFTFLAFTHLPSPPQDSGSVCPNTASPPITSAGSTCQCPAPNPAPPRIRCRADLGSRKGSSATRHGDRSTTRGSRFHSRGGKHSISGPSASEPNPPSERAPTDRPQH